MTDLTSIHILLLVTAATLAGIVDTLAGGGGLITVPALMAAGVSPVLALGTNKLQSCLCEISATLAFRKKFSINFKILKWAILTTLIGSLVGTSLLQNIEVTLLKRLVPFILCAVFLFNLLSKNSKTDNAIPLGEEAKLKRLAPMGLAIGFYNGFFGPGTGTIWAVSLKKFLRLGIREATMMTKPLNLVGNLTALSIFFAGGKINFTAGILMGIGSFVGGLIGAQLVIYKDSRWLQWTFNVLMAVCVIGAFRAI